MKPVGRRLWCFGMAVVVGGVLLTGCGARGGGGEAGASDGEVDRFALSFRYIGDSGVDETMNQQLAIKNSVPVSVVPVLSFEALDKKGDVLPHVKVGTVYGSDRGRLVAPSGTSGDIMRFSGAGKHDVADVRVTVLEIYTAQNPAGPQGVDAQALDAHGREITRFERFSAVRLTNQDDIAVSVRIVYIMWDQPPKGVTQQAVEVTAIGGLTRVPAYGSAVVKVSGDAASAVARDSNGPAVSLKAYNSQ